MFSLHKNERLQTAHPYAGKAISHLQYLIANGDEVAFTHLYNQYGKRLQQFSFSLVRSKETAEEIVEDVFVRLWSNRAQLPSIENLSVYLYVSVKNRSLNSLSDKARQLVVAPFDFLDTDVTLNDSDPYDLMVTSEMMSNMQKAIDLLPPRCKMIFRLVREDGLKYKEVAEILNISVNTIDVQMAIAVKRICEALHIDKKGRQVLPKTLPGKKHHEI